MYAVDVVGQCLPIESLGTHDGAVKTIIDVIAQLKQLNFVQRESGNVSLLYE